MQDIPGEKTIKELGDTRGHCHKKGIQSSLGGGGRFKLEGVGSVEKLCNQNQREKCVLLSTRDPREKKTRAGEEGQRGRSHVRGEEKKRQRVGKAMKKKGSRRRGGKF